MIGQKIRNSVSDWLFRDYGKSVPLLIGNNYQYYSPSKVLKINNKFFQKWQLTNLFFGTSH